MTILNTAFVDPSSIIGSDVIIEPGSVIGRFPRPLRESATSTDLAIPPTVIQDSCYIGSCVVIERGAIIGHDSTLEHGSVVEAGATVGARCFLVHGARVLVDARIDDDCVIGGLIADRAQVGRGSRVFGSLVHRQSDPSTPWDGTIEDAPILESDVFVGIGARIIGPAVVGHGAYVCANAIVTKNVPPGFVVVGANVLVHPDNWNGSMRRHDLKA